jgi:hypothetical protein
MMNYKKILYTVIIYLLLSLFYYVEMFDCKSFISALIHPFCTISLIIISIFQYMRNDI